LNADTDAGFDNAAKSNAALLQAKVMVFDFSEAIIFENNIL